MTHPLSFETIEFQNMVNGAQLAVGQFLKAAKPWIIKGDTPQDVWDRHLCVRALLMASLTHIGSLKTFDLKDTMKMHGMVDMFLEYMEEESSKHVTGKIIEEMMQPDA